MIRAIFRQGKIHPLSPLPEEWREGQELEIEPASPSTGNEPAVEAEDSEQWLRECDEAAAEISPEEWEKFDAALEAQGRLAKEQVRREMGLD